MSPRRRFLGLGVIRFDWFLAATWATWSCSAASGPRPKTWYTTSPSPSRSAPFTPRAPSTPSSTARQTPDTRGVWGIPVWNLYPLPGVPGKPCRVKAVHENGSLPYSIARLGGGAKATSLTESKAARNQSKRITPRPKKRRLGITRCKHIVRCDVGHIYAGKHCIRISMHSHEPVERE